MHDASGTTVRMIGTMHDIAERKQALLLSEYLAYHEPVTRLPNRAALHKELFEASQRLVPLEHLTLEITETAIMADPARAKTVLGELREAGLQLSTDDFGIGQSSLTYLKGLPITKMKIDKSAPTWLRPRPRLLHQ